MIDFQQISENMQNFLQENAKKTIIVCAILILMVLGANFTFPSLQYLW